MSTAEITVLVLILTLAAADISRRVSTPMPIVLAIAGVLMGVASAFWNLVPRLSLAPDTILLVFLPPLLAAGAYRLPLGAFRSNLRPITSLVVGLVLASMTGVAVVAHALLPNLAWSSAFVLGAIVAPPDPVAAVSIARTTGLRHDLVTILEGEGLVNDATAIVAYQLAVRALVIGTFSLQETGLTLARMIPLGVGAGFAVGWLAAQARRHLDDVALEAGLTLVAAYASYLVAERLGGSTILAVVTLGFVLRHVEPRVASPPARLGTRTVWNAVDFFATSLVFALVGLEIGRIGADTFRMSLVVTGAVLAGIAIVVRLAWMHVIPRITALIQRRRELGFSNRELTVLGWTGMRGVVSLALALSVPTTNRAGETVGDRGTIVLLALVIILVTLLLQGLTLLPLIKATGVGHPEKAREDEQRARDRAHRAGLSFVQRLRARGEIGERELGRYTRTLCVQTGLGAERVPEENRDVVEQALTAERGIVVRMRDAGRISGDLSDRLETELDVELLRLRRDEARLTAAPPEP